MKRWMMILIGAGLATLFAGGCSRPHVGVDQPWLDLTGGAPADRIGAVERSALLVAYYNGAQRQAWLSDLRRRHDEAEAAGDTALARELEREGRASQDLAHRQLAGRVTLTSILEQIRPELEMTAREADVSMIVEQGYATPEGATVVDVTDTLVRQIEPAR